jgi:hypothetical protein
MSNIGRWSTVVAVSGQDWVLRDEAEAEVERLRDEWQKADDGWVACQQQLRDAVSEAHAIQALGWLSAELAARADAWNGNAPEWFPEPPEWLELWRRALAAGEGQ